MPQAVLGNTVKVAYTGRLEDGSVFDSAEKSAPMEFSLGSDEVIAGFEQAVIGMAVGDKKTVTVPPEEAYGVYHEELVNNIERSTLPEDLDPEVGKKLTVNLDENSTIKVVVTKVTDTTVTFDANLPLAGKTLIFDIQLIEIL